MIELTPAEFRRLRDQLAARCGIYLDESRAQQLAAAIAQRMQALGLRAVPSYAQQLRNSPPGGELRELAELLANHETVFFRNQPHFRALRQKILPELHRQLPPGQPIRCWSAGCATGEEPYSLVITALEVLGSPLPRPVEIYATDISTRALARAREGFFRGRSIGNVSAGQLSSFFYPVAAGHHIKPEVQSLVTFQELNLLDPFPPWTEGLDLIFCQNVTIYFQLATSKSLFERFYQVLSEGGYLFLGFSESLWGIFDRFEMVDLQGSFAYRKGGHAVPERQSPGLSKAELGPAGRRRLEERPLARGLPYRARQSEAVRPSPAPPDPQLGEQVLERARALRAEGQQIEALEELKRLPPGLPQMPAVMALVARLHADLGQWEQAAAEAQRALELDLLQEDAHLLLGVLGLRSGSWQDAVPHLERVRYLNPDLPLGSFYLAECYRQLGRKDQAAREYRNTLRKLEPLEETDLLDGVAVSWLRSSCEIWLSETVQSSTKGKR